MIISWLKKRALNERSVDFSFYQKKISFDIPLAWSQLSHQKVRLAVAIGGIAFANILIFMQLGFRALFTEGATLIADNLHGNLFVITPQTDFIGSGSFERVHLFRVAAIEGVESVTPLYVDYGRWSYSQEIGTFAGRVLAFNLTKPTLNLPEVNQQLWKLKQANTVLVDRQSKPAEFGPVVQRYEQDENFSVLLRNRRVIVMGLFNLGSSFFRSDGNIIMSEENYQEIFGVDALDEISIGIITLKPDGKLSSVQAAINNAIPALEALNREELISRDLQFQEQNPAGIIFSFGAVMGFIVGVVVVYQVLYSDVTDHLPEYATLKAIGFSDRALLVVIFQEALILGVLGFLPGLGISVWMYRFLAHITRLQLVMRLNVLLTVFILTITMCLLSAMIASSKLRAADPADIFS
ncbi:MAG: ABC transporter permease DevC [Cyanobacteria bacterium P01_H01_bin.21]